MSSSPIILWFRRDLRLADNPALVHAAHTGQPVVPVYVADWEHGDRWAPGRAGRWWLERSLGALAASLAALGAPLRVVSGPAPEAIFRLARETGARDVVWNRLYEPFSRNLDGRVVDGLERERIRWQTFEGALLFDPGGRYSRSGRPFVQFTPFWRNCLALPEPAQPECEPGRLRGFQDTGGSPLVDQKASPTGGSGTAPGHGGSAWRPAEGTRAWFPGEAGARARLAAFVEEGLTDYRWARDALGVEGTSRLSPHLHFGEIGPRQVWQAVREAARASVRPGGAGADPWAGVGSFLRQLGWREFAHYLLFHFPQIPTEAFRPEFARFPWEDDRHGLDAWKRGETGYPLVDAAMRQLEAEGWMSNRVRMVVASFLTKDLLIPWQEGAAWFWDRLVDADLANNTLGWQWTAGSGPDAAPYFRVFNPVLQARRFDPQGEYVRCWSGRGSGPQSGVSGTEPAGRGPIVDHARARARALAAFGEIRRDPASRPRGS
jgi:deoxyribodipyrimidine photo-lyase